MVYSVLIRLIILTIILNDSLVNITSAQIRNTKKNFNDINYNIEKMFSIDKNNKTNSNLNFHRQLTVVNLSEFVARIKGGVTEARVLAEKFNLKLVRRVFEDSNYFLFERETSNDDKNLIKNAENNQRIRRSLDDHEMKSLENEPMVT